MRVKIKANVVAERLNPERCGKLSNPSTLLGNHTESIRVTATWSLRIPSFSSACLVLTLLSL